jgi:hypothetical protein
VLKTATAQLIDLKLRETGRSLPTYVKARQLEGFGWRRIAAEIKRDTGVIVSHESLRSWFMQQQDAA